MQPEKTIVLAKVSWIITSCHIWLWRILLAWCFLLFSKTFAEAQWEQKITGPTSLAFSPDGRWLAAGSIEDWVFPGDLRVWEAKSGNLLHKERYVYGVQSLEFSPDGKTLAVATMVEKSKDAIRLWNRRSWRVERTLGGQQYIYSIAFSPDGSRRVAGSNMGETGEADDVYLWNVSARRSRALPHSNGLAQVLFSPRNNLILGAYYSGYYNDNSDNLRAWDAAGRFLWQRPQPGLSDIAFMPDGRTVVAGISEVTDDQKPNKSKKRTEKDTGGALQIWDAHKGRLLQTIKRSESVTAIAVSRDGKLWASGDEQGTVHLWNAATQRIVKNLPLHHDSIVKLAFSPDGLFLASIGRDDRIRLTVLKAISPRQ